MIPTPPISSRYEGGNGSAGGRRARSAVRPPDLVRGRLLVRSPLLTSNRPSFPPSAGSGLRGVVIAVVVVALAVAGCSGEGDVPDAYGNFEAKEVRIPAQASGTLLSFTVREGEHLPEGRAVGWIDTTQLALKQREHTARREAVRSQLVRLQAQVDVLQERKEVAMTERRRIERLLEDEAATEKQLDEVEGQIRVLDREIASVRSQRLSIHRELEALDAQLAQLADQREKHHIVNPIDGTVLVTYAEAHEMASAGRPLYAIADLDTMILRAYAGGTQLDDIRLGQDVEVRVDDDADTAHALPGRISWIASEAEFTPRTIQTKEERVNLVYAFEVRVPNPEGLLKIGMPGEVRFRE